MKKSTLITAIILMAGTLTAQWYPQASGTSEDLHDIAFCDSLTGWAVGSRGVILNTDDGGETWAKQIIDTASFLQDVFFADSIHGWVVGYKQSSPPWFKYGYIYSTSDGGINWEELSNDTLPFLIPVLKEVCFLDTLNGWGAGGIHYTSDGGETWENNFIPPLSTRSIYFTDSLNGWVVGGEMNGSTSYITSYILHTTDGGDTWEYQVDLFSKHTYLLHSICFSDTLNGWAAGGWFWQGGIILQTSNGGNNWDTLYCGNVSTGVLKSICFSDPLNGWAVGGAYFNSERGIIVHMINGGDVWAIQTTRTYEELNDVCFSDQNNGWIVGDNGTILHNGPIVHIREDENSLQQNHINIFPNPFSTSTTIAFELTQPGKVELKIYNQLGELIEVIQKSTQPGKQKLTWDAKDLPSGIYFIRIQVGNELITRKMIKL